jgi:hypothetical protein
MMVERTPVSNKKVSFVPLTSTGITTKLLINLNDILSLSLSSVKKKPFWAIPLVIIHNRILNKMIGWYILKDVLILLR